YRDSILSDRSTAIPDLSESSYSEFSSSNSGNDKSTDDESASFNKNYTAPMKNRYPSSDIAKFDDLSSEEGDRAISIKRAQDHEVIREAASIFYTSYDLETDSEEKTLKIIADGNDILENIDKLKSSNLVNPEITQAFLNIYPVQSTKYVADLAVA